MPLSAGDKLGSYEVLSLIGRGGMGEVYRAHDPRLRRDVAIKVSNSAFSERFTREARIVASLNHTNICHLYDVGPNYLVMELVEGRTLAEILKTGPFPPDRLRRIAGQIADALDAAHEKGVVHRDLKPGNVMVRTDGTVKVLDFGLAKTVHTPASSAADATTVTMDQTEAGSILGTAAYMSPEQAMGQPVDRRSDIYSFGLVVYEMATGKRAHRGGSTTEILASVIKEEPDWARVPVAFRMLLHRCLVKDPQQRLRHIGDVMTLVEQASPPASAPTNSPVASSLNLWLWPSIAAVLLAALAASLLLRNDPQPDAQRVVRFELLDSDKYKLPQAQTPKVSPDGQWIIFAGEEDGVIRQWLRRIDSVGASLIPGIQEGSHVHWASDSKSIAFSVTPGPFSPGKLMRMEIAGGVPEEICNLEGAAGGLAWNETGDIVFSDNAKSVILHVKAMGGEPRPITKRGPEEAFQGGPYFLPDGRHFLYHRYFPNATSRTGIYVGSLDNTAEEQSEDLLIRSDVQAAYTETGGGQLLFQRGFTLFAQSFDPETTTLHGEPVPIAQGVGSFPASHLGSYSASRNGVLAYSQQNARMQLTESRIDAGSARITGPSWSEEFPAYSPDGRLLATARLDNENGSTNIWVTDLVTLHSTKLTQGTGRSIHPAWSPDGKEIVFSSDRAGAMDLYIASADGSGQERPILTSASDKFPWDWSSNGFLIFSTGADIRGSDLWTLRAPGSGTGQPIELVKSEFNESGGRFSPDGRWITYGSDDAGPARWQVYVRPFDPAHPEQTASGPRWVVAQGYYPYWRSDAGAILFQAPSMRLSSVAVDRAQPYRTQADPAALSPPLSSTYFGISPDGSRFATATIPSNQSGQVTIVVNWQAALSQRK
jgi:eukaryotic-like serine/threonine-protein kinase